MSWVWIAPTANEVHRFSAEPVGKFCYQGSLAKIDSVYDADTIKDIVIDLGFRTFQSLDYVRLYGINAPEVRGAERVYGIAARDWMRTEIALAGSTFLIKSWKGKKGKYGRWLVEIFVGDRNLNLELCERGLSNINFYD